MTFHFLSGKKAENQIQEKRHITLISCYNITIMRTFNMSIFRKTKYIETQWHDDAGFHDAIKKLNESGVDYVVKERRTIATWGRLAYFCYSVILDTILLAGIIWAIFNIGKII